MSEAEDNRNAQTPEGRDPVTECDKDWKTATQVTGRLSRDFLDGAIASREHSY